ncbi:uncharacterized protein LOC119634392 isoform X3 [Glossina fuscipes]|uniref:Uncharacterized protein LOC119634392 isoform X3 n=1 Tax=Glossina fuscipes TaxID=7396 RepID=A0A8U0WHG6_9MUSC|nr:uncharacterized protein LOC119634392 isoform X3 [Glossina fuscipes]
MSVSAVYVLDLLTMNLHKLVGIIGLLGLAMSCQAYPTLALPRFHRSVDRIAKGLAMDLGFPKTDDDVLQLERLRELREKKESQPYYHQKKNELIADEIPSVVDESPNTLPELEQQLESAAGETTATPSKAPAETPSEAQTNVGGTGIHRPPHLQNNDGGKAETVAGGGGEKAKAAAKTAESLLKHANGQYSSFDMAQYVFWTGDEAGVARAVEELIHRDAMSREEALKFLHDIRMGIEYLQKSYANRIFPEEIHHNTVKKSFMPTTTTTTTTTTTALPYVKLEQNLQETDSENLNLAKTLDSISLWHKLQALNNEDGQDLADLDASETRHSKITDCEHKEYNLEEIIYKLARIMFTQSLTHGSDEAQKEIQKLTEFLEREHKLGVIPVDLEKKVIHVLLQALSDTLTDKPELWPAAQYPYNRLLRSYAHANYGGSSLNSV